MNKVDVVEEICNLLAKGDQENAQTLAQKAYPFNFHLKEPRKITPVKSLRLYLRDGFIDRYSGQKLVYPGILRLLSYSMPKEFPYQKNWKMSECHIAYYELMPTIDHVVPISRGGKDDESNWVTTSMLRNSAKSNWSLDELGWHLYPPGDLQDWDGLISQFITLFESLPALRNDNIFSNLYELAKPIAPGGPHQII